MGLRTDDDQLTRRVGAIVLFFVGVAVVLVLGLDKIHLRSGFAIELYFSHPGGLKEGADAQVAGRVVGEITNVGLITRRRSQSEPEHLLEGEEGVQITVRIEKRYADMVPKNGEFFITSKGLLGERFLEIGAPRVPGGRELAAPERHVRAGDRIRGVDPAQIDRVIRRSYANLVFTQVFLDRVRPEGRRLRSAVKSLVATLEEIEPAPGAYAELGDSLSRLRTQFGTVGDKWQEGDIDADMLRGLLARGRALSVQGRRERDELTSRVDALLAKIEEVDAAIPADLRQRFVAAVDSVDGSMGKLDRIASDAREIMAMVDRGEGNIGGLLNDAEFSDNAKEIGKILKRQPWRTIGHPQDSE